MGRSKLPMGMYVCFLLGAKPDFVISPCLHNDISDSMLCLERKIVRRRIVSQKIKASAVLSPSLELTAGCKAVRLASKLCQVTLRTHTGSKYCMKNGNACFLQLHPNPQDLCYFYLRFSVRFDTSCCIVHEQILVHK